jgi:hypothetical protein
LCSSRDLGFLAGWGRLDEIIITIKKIDFMRYRLGNVLTGFLTAFMGRG